MDVTVPAPPGSGHPLTLPLVLRPLATTSATAFALLKGLDTHWNLFVLASLAMGLEAAVWVPKFLVWSNCKPAPWFRFVQIGTFFLVWLVNPLRILCGVTWGYLWFTGVPTYVTNRHRWHQMWALRRARRDGHMATHGVTPGAVLAGGAGQQAQAREERAESKPPMIRVGATHDQDRILSYTPSGDVHFGGWNIDENGYLR